jgi:flagellar biosynthetic protein FlhB
MLLVLLPLGAAVMLAALAGVLCGGWNFTLKPLQPKFSKLNPLSGSARMFSKVQLVDTLKACLLAVVLGPSAAATCGRTSAPSAMPNCWPCRCRRRWPRRRPARRAAAAAGVMAPFALVDVPLQRWRCCAKQLKMSHQEVKKEFKESRATRGQGQDAPRMRELASRRMLAAVPRPTWW